MKRVIHYLLLAGLLLGLPLACCVLGGYEAVLADVTKIAPCCENWANEPARLWRVRCPFSWTVFALFTVITFASIVPFLYRLLRAFAVTQTLKHSNTQTMPKWGYLGLVLMSVGWVLAWTRFAWFAPFQRYPYILQWAGFILLVNALCVKRSGRSPLTSCTRSYLLSFPISSLFWWFFEYLNRYVWNWYYVGVPGISPVEYVIFATVCFASVLPGVTAVAALLGTFPAFAEEAYAGMIRIDIRSKASVLTLAVLTTVGLTGIVFCPQFAYPLLWISPLMGFVLVQVLLKEKSSLDVLATGNWGLVFRFAVAAVVCGLVWETWNYYSLAKWIYNVPWVERWKIWEMPVIGFAGYLPFGMECAAVAAWLDPRLISVLGKSEKASA